MHPESEMRRSGWRPSSSQQKGRRKIWVTWKPESFCDDFSGLLLVIKCVSTTEQARALDSTRIALKLDRASGIKTDKTSRHGKHFPNRLKYSGAAIWLIGAFRVLRFVAKEAETTIFSQSCICGGQSVMMKKPNMYIMVPVYNMRPTARICSQRRDTFAPGGAKEMNIKDVRGSFDADVVFIKLWIFCSW